MNADLESQLDEMGPEYRAVANRLRAAAAVRPSARMTAWRAPKPAFRRPWPLAAAALAAAVLALAAALVAGRRPGAGGRVYAVRLTNAAREYRLAFDRSREALGELLRTQNPDGSWSNDFLTRQNAAALRERGEAPDAYKRAVRYLKSQGLAPLTAGELARLGAHGEAGAL